MEKISIIIPAFNSEKTIFECVKSALSQTYPNIEVVLIDDGSTDLTALICRDLAKDERVVFRSVQNGGPSQARNLGMSLSTGDWLMFLDADDCLSPDICYTLYRVARDNDAQCAFCNLENQYESNGAKEKLKPFNGEKRIFKGSDLEALEYRLVGKDSETGDPMLCLSGPVCKLINKNVCEGIYFPTDIDLGEDTCFSLMILHKCSCVVYVDQYLYLRNLSTNSLSYSNITAMRLAGYTNWILDNYYDNPFYKAAVARIYSINYCWLMDSLISCGNNIDSIVSELSRYKSMLNHNLSFKELVSGNNGIKQKTVMAADALNLGIMTRLLVLLRMKVFK